MSVLSSENIILVERTGDIVTVILNRPNKLNALNKAMWQRLAVVMNELNDDHSIRCVILRGAGDKAMGPGADISEFESERCDSTKAAEYLSLIHISEPTRPY